MHIHSIDGFGILLKDHGLNLTGQQSVFFKVKTCDAALIVFFDDIDMSSDIFKVDLDRTINIFTYGNEGGKQQQLANASWSGLDCNSYVPLWVSWLNRTIKAGAGTKIGGSILISLTDIDYNANVNNVGVRSLKSADWIFDFLAEEITGKLKIEMSLIRNSAYDRIYP